MLQPLEPRRERDSKGTGERPTPAAHAAREIEAPTLMGHFLTGLRSTRNRPGPLQLLFLIITSFIIASGYESWVAGTVAYAVAAVVMWVLTIGLSVVADRVLISIGVRVETRVTEIEQAKGIFGSIVLYRFVLLVDGKPVEGADQTRGEPELAVGDEIVVIVSPAKVRRHIIPAIHGIRTREIEAR